MQIKLNNKTIEINGSETIIDIARREGYEIPSLCYSKGMKHKSSCMVCAVKNVTNGQIIPSCSTIASDKMDIEVDSEEIQKIRKFSLELLLSDHRADCEAPCCTVCPSGLDIEKMLKYFDLNKADKAYEVISEAFDLPTIACHTCTKAPCEKVCRRGTIDKAVKIRDIVDEIVQTISKSKSDESAADHSEVSSKKYIYNKSIFTSKLGRFTMQETNKLKETVDTKSNCLHCACAGSYNCQLRLLATQHGIKRSRYNTSSKMPILNKIKIKDNMWFEQSKCIRCGLCVYNSNNGFTFKNRGFGMEITIPNENKGNVNKSLADICPTGAIYICEDNILINSKEQKI